MVDVRIVVRRDRPAVDGEKNNTLAVDQRVDRPVNFDTVVRLLVAAQVKRMSGRPRARGS
jgi:hypothetical protein